MTPAARLSAAIEVLDQYLAGSAAEKALTNWARRSRFAGSKDRAAVRDIVFDCLRKRGTYARYGAELTGRGLVVGHAQQGRDFLEVQALFTGEGYAPARLNSTEESAIIATPHMTPDMSFNMPDWLRDELIASVNDEALAVAQAFCVRASVFLRVNLSKISRQGAIQSLAGDGIVAVPHDLAKTALEVIENPRKISTSHAYNNGLVELQDVASQAICLGLPKASRMLDYCAGGGGKVLAYGDQNDARLFAHDAIPARLRDLSPRAKRAGLSVDVLSTASCRKAAPFDLVLCDVPCSGSGAWRRSPDGKWSLSEEDFHNLLNLQQEILNAASNLVARDGVLAYVTCSVFSRENEAQIAEFCHQNKGWSSSYQRRYSPLEGGDGFYVAYLTHAVSDQ